ncbi:MAG: O-acetylhomoserine aminocarboxypropyltransferase/cysteine synthase [Firmicutes bacterium]|nr:O-acetylhomoserine aminocarboxypropyltransferase/cysteine synthase [Bacillota bacterium]
MSQNWKIETKAVQGTYSPKNSETRVVPIYQSTTYKYDTSEQVAKLFDLEAEGHMYTRISNPTIAEFEEKMSLLEGGAGAMATSSGQAATALAILNICGAGQHIVAASTIYGGTFSLLSNTLKKIGIEISFVNPDAEPEEIKGLFRPETKALFAETIGNPGLNVLDFEKFSTIAKEMDVPLIIDNTFATPYLCTPLRHGANIVIHSASKYIDGHAISVGGVIVDGGNYNWNNGKYPDLTEPDPSYHGVKYVERFKEQAYIVKCRVQLLRDFGSTMSPFNAFLSHLGLETLHVRMDRHCENALKLAQYLEQHPKVNWVSYPGLPSHPSYALISKYLPKGCSGVLTFGIKGGLEAGIRFIDHVKLTALVVHVADVRTCVLHPASTTHRQLTEEQQVTSGVTPDLVRVSVGIENIEDIIADFEQALDHC